MHDLILWKNRRTTKSNTYSVHENDDNTITLTPVVGEVIEEGTSFNQTHMNVMDYGINEAMIIANLAILEAHQNGKELKNTGLEIGTVEVTSSEEYPFNTERVTIAMGNTKNTLDYMVFTYCDDLEQGRAIRVRDKQLNGFKLEIDDCPKKPVKIKYYIMGGMT